MPIDLNALGWKAGDKLVRRRLVSDGFHLDSQSMNVEKEYRRSPDRFWNEKGVPAHDSAKMLAMSYGFRTSPAGTTFNIVIIPSHILPTKGSISKGRTAIVTPSEVEFFARTHGFAPPPPEVGYHLCHEPDCRELIRSLGIHKLIIMSRPFPDHAGDPSRWAIELLDIPKKKNTKSEGPSKKETGKELTLTDARDEALIFQSDGLVFLEKSKS